MKAIDLTKEVLSSHYKGFPAAHFTGAGVLGVALLFFSMSSPSNESRLNEQVEFELPISISSSVTPTENSLENPVNIADAELSSVIDITNHTETVKSGDNLSFIFNRAGLSDTKLYQFMRSHPDTKQLTRLHPGQKFIFSLADKELQSLTYQKNRLQSIAFTKTADGYEIDDKTLKPDVHIAYREATIKDSLFLAGTKAGMEQSLIMELASIFGWDIDFALDIRQNDSFKVLYEEQFLEGEKYKNGAILATEFTNQGKTFRAVRFTDNKGTSNYYTPEGKSMRKAFLRTPVDFARISSHFNLKRKHPVLNTIRAHKGTDYAAPRGTPIKAAGDGKVTFAGTKSGFGKTVILQHGQRYKTLYAHMNKYGRGVRSGTRVKQGQIIGYVGSTGLATGPHLHYEFHVNGAVRNPVRVALPQAKSINKTILPAFLEQTQSIVAQMDSFTQQNNNLQVAKANALDTTTQGAQTETN